MILHFIINGFIAGLLYSLFAIGFSLVYNTTRIFHIAAAALYVIAAYGFYFFSNVMSIPICFAAILSVCFTMFSSLLLELIVYYPFKIKKASLNVTMIASIGVMTILVNIISLYFGNETKVIDNSIQNAFTFGEITVTAPQTYQAVVGFIALAVFVFFIRWTRLGIEIKALSSDEVLFEILGYRTKRMRQFVFLLSGLFIALASCLTVYDTGLDPHMGMNVLVSAMVAMIIGGIGNFNFCILGGLFLGILQSLTVYFFASNWQNAITFIILLLFLFLRPQGIAGYKQRTI